MAHISRVCQAWERLSSAVASLTGVQGSAKLQAKRRGSCLLQVNATGVMPVIFSSSLLALPTALERYLGNIPGLQQGARALAPNGPLYLPVSTRGAERARHSPP